MYYKVTQYYRKSICFLSLCICVFLVCSCDNFEASQYKKIRKANATAEYIYRKDEDKTFLVPMPTYARRTSFPFEQRYIGKHPKITKEFFRCKGSVLHSSFLWGEERIYDCNGSDSHSLPIEDGHEFIYPILIDILNYLQDKTHSKVVITSGHRCPQHNRYVDPSRYNQFSKHTIGAEVDFYVVGYEDRPFEILEWIFHYYRSQEYYQQHPEYQNFVRYEKSDTNVSIMPWYNKEIFIKLFQEHEGRNQDNQHDFPYLSVQVRYDKESQRRVMYSWDKAFYNFYRK